MKHLPSLRAVRAFEACYRLGSFTRAAGSLNVRQPAISHQMRLLEQDLGVALFIRKGASIEPTEAADIFYRTVSSALGDIAKTSEQLRKGASGQAITLATYPGVAAYWVMPRLTAFRQAWPSAVVRVVTAEQDTDIPLSDVDCAILFGGGRWPGFESALVVPEAVVPVAAPTLAREFEGIDPNDLLRDGPLIHLEDPEGRWFTWEDWRARFAPAQGAIDRSVMVTNHGVAIHQALTGAGVALGWTGVIADLIETGALHVLQPEPLTSDRGYHLIATPQFRSSTPGKRLWRALTGH